jgi:hypothetical protein
MAQSHVGRCPISKGIGGAIRKFVMFAFNAPLTVDLSGERPRDSIDEASRLARICRLAHSVGVSL